MTKYYKIYHYSVQSKLSEIHPNSFSIECADALKRGACGINKAFFYINDRNDKGQPRFAHELRKKYEVYLSCDWEIYDLNLDPEKLNEKVKNQLAVEKQYPYDWLVLERVEKLIIERGFHGHTYGDGVIALFYPLSTKKPEGFGQVFDYNTHKLIDRLGEDLRGILFYQTSLHKERLLTFFSNENHADNIQQLVDNIQQLVINNKAV